MPAKSKPVEPKITRRKLTDYTPDMSNANSGTERGLAMLEESLSQDGVGRSIVADAYDRIPAGNKTLEAAMNAGIEDVIEVETDGHALIVHKRRDWDLADVQGAARRYAYRDNRTSQVSLTWDAEQLLADVNAGFDFAHLFSENELNNLLHAIEPFNPNDEWVGMPEYDQSPLAYKTIHLHFKTEQDVQAFAELIEQIIGDATKTLWFPAQEKRDLQALGYQSDEP